MQTAANLEQPVHFLIAFHTTVGGGGGGGGPLGGQRCPVVELG